MSTVANTIVAQMGGFGRLRAMVNARDFVYSDNHIQFSFSGSRYANKCLVRLDGDDTYTFELWHYNKRTADCNCRYTSSGVYCDMLVGLFESLTGLYLSL